MGPPVRCGYTGSSCRWGPITPLSGVSHNPSYPSIRPFIGAKDSSLYNDRLGGVALVEEPEWVRIPREVGGTLGNLVGL